MKISGRQAISELPQPQRRENYRFERVVRRPETEQLLPTNLRP